MIVARGAEGGGHGLDAVATLPLLEGVLDAVSQPVLAAGGIVTPRGLAAVLAAGAAGAWIGTALLACPEALTDAQARARILAARETGTVYTRVFDIALRIGWPPEYGGRALANEFSRRWAGREDELAAADGAREELSAARKRGDYDIAYQYAGQGVGLVREERPAAEVVGRARGRRRAAAAQLGMTMADCRFDAILAGDAPAWFVLDEPEVVGFLDVRPLFKGHVLVLPRAHFETLADLPRGLIEPLFGCGAADQRGDAGRARRPGQLRGDQQHGEPERPAPARPRGAADQGRRAARLLLAARPVRRRRRGGAVRPADARHTGRSQRSALTPASARG